MRRLVLGLVVVVVVIGVLGVIGYLWATRYGEIAAIEPVQAAELDSARVERGEMLVALGDCVVCHTSAGGEPLAGGLALPTPFGTIYSTNITPDPETGIGRWSEAAFLRAMHEGIDRSGNHLYPAFPYDHFSLVTNEDVGAIYAYLMSLPAVSYRAPENELPFPYSFRPILEGWNILFHHQQVYTPDTARDEEWNRGAYLVNGLGHCGACHSPRNAFGAVDSTQPLAGGAAENWYVPALGGASRSPVPWTQEAYVNYLFDGWDEHHGIAAGPMIPVVNGLYDVEEDDVFAMATYLASLSAAPTDDAVDAEVATVAALDWGAEERPGGTRAPDEPALQRGEATFFAQCVDCHKARVSKSQPASLGFSATITAADAHNLADVIIHGIVPARGSVQRSMPGQGLAITDEEMVDLINFIRWRFTDLPGWSDVDAAIADKRTR